MKKALLVAAILLAITSIFYLKDTSTEALPPAEMQTQRALEQGGIIGFARDKSHGWRGIPYAAAPVAELRWKAPRPAPPWSDVRQALAPSPACPQIGGELGGVDRSQFNQVIGQEDCLYLDVWAPAFAPDKVPSDEQALPVMVWIHGGGNSVGRGSEYAGAKLSDEHDVIVVSINYRLGVLGWFSHPSMRQGNELAVDNTAIFGTNRDEGRLFMLRDPKFVDATLGVFYRAKNPESYKRLSEYTSRLWKLVGSDAPARAITSSETHPVWTYRFDWDESSDSIFADLPLLLGAAHGLEIPFVFGNLSFPLPGIFTDDNLVAAETLSAAMRSYWTEFAYRGDPGRGRDGDLPLWPS